MVAIEQDECSQEMVQRTSSCLHFVPAGFASQPTSDHVRDGLQMRNAFMTAVVRCAPPQNKPLASELTNCGPYLDRELVLLSHVRVALVFGQVAFKAYLERLRRQEDAIPRLEIQTWPEIRNASRSSCSDRILSSQQTEHANRKTHKQNDERGTSQSSRVT